jgi:hypothetical protein
MSELVSFGRQLARHASDRGTQAAIVHVEPSGQEHELTWRDLDR